MPPDEEGGKKKAPLTRGVGGLLLRRGGGRKAPLTRGGRGGCYSDEGLITDKNTRAIPRIRRHGGGGGAWQDLRAIP